MNITIKNLVLLLVVLGILGAGYAWLSPIQAGPTNSSKGYVSTSVPAPLPGQKKVVLRNLGMA